MVWRESGRTPQTFTVFPSKKLSPTQIFYGEQLVYLIRCLPLQTGFETYLPIFSNGNITNQRIFVEDREPIITPAGVFNTWKVSYGNKGAESFYWISDDSHRYPVKMTASPIGGTVELVSISKYEKNRPTEYLDQEIRFSLPSGWFAMPSTPVVIAEKEHMERWQGTRIGDPEFRTAGSVTVMNYFPKRNAQLLLSETVDGLIKANQAIYENYEVRPGSTENITVLGLPGVRLIVDRPTSGNNDIVIYYYVISAGDKAIRAFFRSRKEDFDRFKPVFDSIIDSIRLR